VALVNLVADVGGTNMRLAISDTHGVLKNMQVYQCKEYDSLSAILHNYLGLNGLSGQSVNACIAIACPVDEDEIILTNLPWTFSKSALKAEFGFNQLALINDYTAMAFAAATLSNEQKVQIGNGNAIDNKPISICGPGTGLGVSNAVFADEKCICISGEGGHTDFAPLDSTQISILEYLSSIYERVSYEQLLSGLGIEQIYQAISKLRTGSVDKLTAQEITEKATAKSCELCHEALSVFCSVLGSFAGNLALTFGSFGGVYIAGGIAPRFIEFISNSEFRQSFEAKGRLSRFVRDIPTYIITEPQPGLFGASAYLQQNGNEEL